MYQQCISTDVELAMYVSCSNVKLAVYEKRSDA